MSQWRDTATPASAGTRVGGGVGRKRGDRLPIGPEVREVCRHLVAEENQRIRIHVESEDGEEARQQRLPQSELVELLPEPLWDRSSAACSAGGSGPSSHNGDSSFPLHRTSVPRLPHESRAPPCSHALYLRTRFTNSLHAKPGGGWGGRGRGKRVVVLLKRVGKDSLNLETAVQILVHRVD